MSNCGECGGFTNSEDVGARYARHHYECTCIRCEECGDVTGNSVESSQWNWEQQELHNLGHLFLELAYE